MAGLDAERTRRIEAAGLDAVVCLLPQHILMLSGYRPRLGNGVALATNDGRIAIAVPNDEVGLARATGVEDPVGFETVTLTSWTPVAAALGAALKQVRERLRPGTRIGFEDAPLMTPNAYVSTLQLGAGLRQILATGLDGCELRPAGALLRELQGHKTAGEIATLRAACALGELAFAATRKALAPGRMEHEVAAAAIAALHSGDAGSARARSNLDASAAELQDRGGEVWVMSGPNSALASRAFARSSGRRLQAGDFVLVHMNPQVGGIWADLTRTFVLGEPGARQREIMEAVLAARLASRPAIRAGATGRAVDAAARSALARRGYGDAFKHGLGHGIGFDGISAGSLPSLHPLSDDRLDSGMCFNVEPAIYIEGYGGCRHCDALVLGSQGAEELSPFLSTLPDLVVPV